MFLSEFCDFLSQMNTAKNTSVSYMRDVSSFLEYFNIKNMSQLKRVKTYEIDVYLKDLLKSGKSQSTVQRAKSSISKYYCFLIKNDYISENPTKSIKLTAPERKLPKMISTADINKLLSYVPTEEFKGFRDKAIVELLYATGMKATQVIDLTVKSFNFDVGYVAFQDENHIERVLPIYPQAVETLKSYFDNFRKYVAASEEKAFFVNTSGESLTRQGFWKIVVTYAQKAGLSSDITPQTLRHSFAYHMAQNGADRQLVSDILGYSMSSTAQVYFKMLKTNMMQKYSQFHPRA